MRHLNKLILLTILCSSVNVFCQDDKRRELDSLLRLWQSNKENADLNNKISLLYIDFFEENDSSKYYAEKANRLALAHKLKYTAAESFVTLGRIQMDNEQPDSASALFFQALMQLNSANKNGSGKFDQIIIDFADYRTCVLSAHIYANFASAYRKKMNLSKAVDFYLRALRAYEIAHDSTVNRLHFCMQRNGEKITKEDLTIKAAQEYLKKHPEDIAAQAAGREGSKMLAGLRWTYMDLGGLFEKTKDYDQSLLYLKKAERNAREVGAKESYLRILRTIGIVFTRKAELDSAAIYFYRMRAHAFDQQNLQYITMANAQLGAVFSEKKDFKKALEFHQQTDSLLAPVLKGTYVGNPLYAGIESKVGEYLFVSQSAYNDELIGDIYSGWGQTEKAKQYYLSSIENFRAAEKNQFIPGVPKNNIAVFMNYKLGELYSKTGLHEKAVELLMKALPQVEASDNLDDRLNIYKTIYQAGDRKGDAKLSYPFFKKYIELKDSIFGQQNAAEMNDLQKRFEVEKKDASIDLLEKSQQAKEAELEKQKLVRNGFIAGSVIFLLLTLVIFRSLQQNRKAKKIIENQKEEVEHKNKEILDSITYAKRIQTALMPRKEYFEKVITRLNQKQ